MRVTTPTTIVIFGATGDLSKRKILPALFHLYRKGTIAGPLHVVGFSRGDMPDTDFCAFAERALAPAQKSADASAKSVRAFLNTINYQQGLFENLEAYKKLAARLGAIDESLGFCSNKLFYLAVPPSLYEVILRKLARSGLTIPCSGDEGWTRVLVEKPFGNDLKTALKLDRLLGKLFQEQQIFRIDHYLGKETLQNILSFRFSNTIFEPLWSRKFIESVHIRLLEGGGVGERGAFYDQIGALRDVGQNHLLQMLALIAMSNPKEMKPDSIRKERENILRQILPMSGQMRAQNFVRGQYAGYRRENAVAKKSQTETYFHITAFLRTSRWKGVPFYLESGKGLKESKAEIEVRFRAPENCFCPPPHEKHFHHNILTFRVQPDEGIAVQFWAKKPGFTADMESRTLAFRYHDGDDILDAYEKLLFDAFRGDQTLFTSTGEVMASWKFVMPILENWQKTKLHIYKKNGEGPDVKII